eukprot:CAMPEP_0197577988 /NCGR_PEP_ID=MMETSP1326-20131121/2406_1 /TAXON_ID=1155430 /ORGANISM="Genus nov. species nov., Strain RCC2288" /LENGTH=215 /DNA_ID=CAMNT_0043141133 /DNA_START=89 /DNA_END=736 /DNA_ORIENTATION=+
MATTMFASITSGVRAGAGALSRMGLWDVVARAVITTSGGAGGAARAAPRGNAGWAASALAAGAGNARMNNVGRAASAALVKAPTQQVLARGGGTTARWVEAMNLAAARGLVTNVSAGGAFPAAAAGGRGGAAARLTRVPAAIAQQTRGMKQKIKGYSSWKGRFQITSSGKYIRKQKGKRHKAFSKTPKQRAQLRSTKLVHKSLVQPMKKLGFKLR